MYTHIVSSFKWFLNIMNEKYNITSAFFFKLLDHNRMKRFKKKSYQSQKIIFL